MVLSRLMRELGAIRFLLKLFKHILRGPSIRKQASSIKSSHVPAQRTSGWASPSPWSRTGSPQNLLAARSAESWITTLNVFDPAEVDTSCLKVVLGSFGVILLYGSSRAGRYIFWKGSFVKRLLPAWEQLSSTAGSPKHHLSGLRFEKCQKA